MKENHSFYTTKDLIKENAYLKKQIEDMRIQYEEDLEKLSRERDRIYNNNIRLVREIKELGRR